MEDQITIEVFDGSDLIHLGLFKNLVNGIKSCAQDGYALVKMIKVYMLAPSLDEDRNTRLRLKEINSKGLNLIMLLNLS